MILRRVIKHFREQEWTAIALDFLIVVAGVFMGLQVQQWNDDRKEAAQEQKYYHRLHAEVEKGVAETRNAYEFQQTQRKALDGALEAFTSGSGVERLTGNQCASIYFSHIFDDAFIPLPTVSELLTSGRLSILKENELRDMLAVHFLALDGWEDVVDGIQADRVVLTSRYPELIRLGVDFSRWSNVQRVFIDQGSFNEKITCDLEGMRTGNGFKNDLIDNSSRQDAYFEYVTKQYEQLNAIHAELDAILGINHMAEPTH